MNGKINLHLAEAVNIYKRLIEIIPYEDWNTYTKLNESSKEVAESYSFDLCRRIDSLKDMLGDNILKEQVSITSTNQARYFFNEILPREGDISSFWAKLIGLDFSFLDDIDVNNTFTRKTPLPKTLPYYIENIEELMEFGFEKAEDYLEDGGSSPDIIIDNDTYDKGYRLIKAKFFKPNRWNENLDKIRPLVLNSKKMPRVLTSRVRELYTCLIIGLPSSSTILARSILEYSLLERADSFSIKNTEAGGSLKKLGILVNEYSEKIPEIEISMRSVKKLGDNAVHAYVGQKNVVTFPCSGARESFQAWSGLCEVLENIYA